MSYSSLGNHSKAIANATVALRLEPDHVVAYQFRGQSYVYMGLLDNAIADLTRAIELCKIQDPGSRIT